MIDEDPVLRVLCADDDHDTADTLVVLLEIAGLDATAYYDGSSVLAAAESIHPEVLILDLAMPGLNGDEVAKRVRAGSGGKPSCSLRSRVCRARKPVDVRPRPVSTCTSQNPWIPRNWL